MSSRDRDRSLLEFLTWMGIDNFLGLVGFPTFLSFSGLCPFCILSVYFWVASLFFVINTCYFYP